MWTSVTPCASLSGGLIRLSSAYAPIREAEDCGGSRRLLVTRTGLTTQRLMRRRRPRGASGTLDPGQVRRDGLTVAEGERSRGYRRSRSPVPRFECLRNVEGFDTGAGEQIDHFRISGLEQGHAAFTAREGVLCPPMPRRGTDPQD